MNKRHTAARNRTSKTSKQTTDTATLTAGKYADRVLPSSAIFALVARLVQGKESEPFPESRYDLLLGGATASRYLAVAGGKLAVYQSDGTQAVSTSLKEVRVDRDHQRFVLHMGKQKFRIEEAIGLQASRVPSKVVGLNDGLNPFLDILVKGGATVKRPASVRAALWYSTFIAIFLIILAVMVVVNVNK